MDGGLPRDGWWPLEMDAPMCQWFRKGGRSVAQVVRQGGQRWRAFSMVEMNKSGTSGKPLFESVATREEARQQCEEYAAER